MSILTMRNALTQEEAALLLHYTCNAGIANTEDHDVQSILQAHVRTKPLLAKLEQCFLVRL